MVSQFWLPYPFAKIQSGKGPGRWGDRQGKEFCLVFTPHIALPHYWPKLLGREAASWAQHLLDTVDHSTHSTESMLEGASSKALRIWAFLIPTTVQSTGNRNVSGSPWRTARTRAEILVSSLGVRGGEDEEEEKRDGLKLDSNYKCSSIKGSHFQPLTSPGRVNARTQAFTSPQMPIIREKWLMGLASHYKSQFNKCQQRWQNYGTERVGM